MATGCRPLLQIYILMNSGKTSRQPKYVLCRYTTTVSNLVALRKFFFDLGTRRWLNLEPLVPDGPFANTWGYTCSNVPMPQL